MIHASGKRTALNQAGFVAIITATIVTVIVFVVVMAFTVIVRREETQARDRQLSTQALYAAESGVNYAIKSDLPSSPTNCSSVSNIDGANSISAPCILINDEPNELVFDEISTETPTVMYLTNSVNDLTFAWHDPDGSAPFSSSTKFLRAGGSAGWGSRVGVLEVMIYPVDSVVNTTNGSVPNRLVEQAKAFYLYPNQVSSAGSVGTVSYSDDGKVVYGNCHPGNTPRHCNVRITGIPNGLAGATGSRGYVIRLRAIYNPVSVQVTGRFLGSATALKGVQRVVDATGRATDVLRRIQVRLPVRQSYNLPIYAVETADDLCKRLNVYPNQPSTYNPDGC